MKKVKIIIMLMFMSLLLVGCGKNNIDEATKDSINKGDSDASISILVSHGIDLESIKPEGVISTITYEEYGDNENGVIFYIDGESNRKNSFIHILDYLKLVSGNIYDYDNKEYDYTKEVTDKTKKEEVIYKYNDESIKVKIEYKERSCPKDAKNKKCDTYGIVFE